MDQNTLPERLDRTVIYESDYVCLYADKVRLPSGYIIEKYHQVHYPKEAVSIVIFNEKNEILMIREKRYTVGRLEWEIPAGKIEEGESKEDAARREAMEETVVPEHTTRALTRNYEDKMFLHIAGRGITRFLLPFPLRMAITVVKAVPYIAKGLRSAFPCWPSCLPWSFTGGQGSRNKCVRRTVPLSQKERV